MYILLAAIALISFVIYGIAIKRLFSADHGVDWRMQAIKLCGAVFTLIHLWAIWKYRAATDLLSAFALLTYLTGLGVFFAAYKSLAGYRLTLAFSDDIPERILDQGIYGYIRHPFYLAYSLTWLGGVLAAPSIWTTSTTAVMLYFYWKAAKQEEHKFLTSGLSSAYQRYKNLAGMFFLKISD